MVDLLGTTSLTHWEVWLGGLIDRVCVLSSMVDLLGSVVYLLGIIIIDLWAPYLKCCAG